MRLFLMLLCLSGLVFAAEPGAFYVAVNGNDGNAGSVEAPFATLHRAQAAVRELISAGLDADVHVYICGGTYYLNAPLVFTEADSGTEAHRVVYQAYKNETPVLSGGSPVAGWTAGENHQWKAVLPEVRTESWRFRQLFRGETRLPRGRFPDNEALLRVEAVNEAVTEITLRDALPMEIVQDDDAELVVFQNWSITRVGLMSASGKNMLVSRPAGWIGHGSMTTTSPDKPCYIENALALVNDPGEWYLNRRTGELTYQATPDEDPNTLSFVAPRLHSLVQVEGKANAPVQNLHFIGLTFAHAEWALPDIGYCGIQAGHYGAAMDQPAHVLPGALSFVHAVNCGLEQCRIVHTGPSGVVLGAGCRNNNILFCTLEDIGGNGVMVGWRGASQSTDNRLIGDASLSADWTAPDLIPVGNTVADCSLRRCGAVNHGCVAIYDAFCDGTRISHNDIAEMPYTGISIGFRWNSSETSQKNCVVEYNHVRDVMRMLADGGCIYTLGLQPGTVLRGNLLHDVHRSAYAHGGAPNNGIFFDEGSKGFLVEDNIIYNTSGEPIRFNQTGPKNLSFRNNHFGVVPEAPDFPTEAAQKTGTRRP